MTSWGHYNMHQLSFRRTKSSVTLVRRKQKAAVERTSMGAHLTQMHSSSILVSQYAGGVAIDWASEASTCAIEGRQT